MSRQRQTTRTQRAAATAARTDAERRQREKAAADRARRDRRALAWRRLRLWHNDQRRSDTRERLGAMGALVLLVLIGVFVWTRSVAAVAVAALVLLISTPVLVLLFFDRRHR